MSVLDYVLSLGTVVGPGNMDVVNEEYDQIYNKILTELQKYVPITIITRRPNPLYDSQELTGYLDSRNTIARTITGKPDIVLTPATYPVLAQVDQKIYNLVCTGIYYGTRAGDDKLVYLVRGFNHVCCFCIIDRELYFFDPSYDEHSDHKYLKSFLLCHPHLIGMPIRHVFKYNFQLLGDRRGFYDVFCRLWTTYFIHSIYVMGRSVRVTVQRLERNRIACMREILMYIYADDNMKPHELLS